MSLTYTPAGSNAFILNDELDVIVGLTNNRKVTNIRIAEPLAKLIYKTITSFDVAKIQAMNKIGKLVNQVFVINDEEAILDSLVTATLDLNRNVNIFGASLFVSSNEGAGVISNESLITLADVLKDSGAEPDPTFGKYRDIKLVIEPPTPLTMEDEVVYVLTVAYKDLTAGTAMMISRDEEGGLVRNLFDTKTGKLTPMAYGDPTDADSYPVKPATELTGNVGSADDPVVEVVNRELSETTSITAGEDVNLVHNTMNDGIIRITVA